VVEHFVHGPQPTLREAFRVLQRGGTLVLTVPHPQFVEALYQLRNQIRPSKVARAGYYERTYAHQELAAHVRAVGFNIQQITPIGHSYTFYGLHPAFRQQGGYYEVSPLAETFGKLGKAIFPWQTAFQTLIIAHKP
jgi:SAM-dependent methyltransferase